MKPGPQITINSAKSVVFFHLSGMHRKKLQTPKSKNKPGGLGRKSCKMGLILGQQLTGAYLQRHLFPKPKTRYPNWGKEPYVVMMHCQDSLNFCPNELQVFGAACFSIA